MNLEGVVPDKSNLQTASCAKFMENEVLINYVSTFVENARLKNSSKAPFKKSIAHCTRKDDICGILEIF